MAHFFKTNLHYKLIIRRIFTREMMRLVHFCFYRIAILYHVFGNTGAKSKEDFQVSLV